ncbi:MAG: type II toxin-antitoxin system RelE/ParE family toxin [Patescibacteria group bacterium]|nr:type II toxin-antitoxin system RelE/ParE family toxin [Patescibacteria group bacterium]
MSWKVRITKKASKEMKRISIKDAKRLLFILEEFTKDPYQGNIKKIKGENDVWRRRFGNYRILYEVIPNKKHIYIFQICRRTTNTYQRRK